MGLKEMNEMLVYKERLLQEYAYSDRVAEMTAWDLVHLTAADCRSAAQRWVESGEMTDVAVQEFSVRRLMQHQHFRYPAALIMMDWMQRDPEKAKEFLFSLM